MIDQLEPPFLDLHAAQWTAPDRYEIRPDARRFENWETNYAAKIGLGVAVDYALSWGIDAIAERITALAEQPPPECCDRSTASPSTTRDDSSAASSRSPWRACPPQEVQEQLAERGINVSVSLVEYARLDLSHRGLPDLVRASVHYYNTDDELDRLIHALPEP